VLGARPEALLEGQPGQPDVTPGVQP
jgi:hypothetical protein